MGSVLGQLIGWLVSRLIGICCVPWELWFVYAALGGLVGWLVGGDKMWIETALFCVRVLGGLLGWLVGLRAFAVDWDSFGAEV